MTCTREEKEAYEGFQRNRGDKVILVRMSCGDKMSLTNDQRSRSHIKGDKQSRDTVNIGYTRYRMKINNRETLSTLCTQDTG
jgi:hypothetical protein